MPDNKPTGRRRRGNAEIELLLVIPVLIAILLLTQLAWRLGAARLSNTFAAGNGVYTQVLTGRDVQVSSDPVPPDGIAAVRPGLPNRLDEERPGTVVDLAAGNIKLPPVTLPDRAVMLDPTWHLAAWPQPADQADVRAWFEAYVAEDHSADVVTALGLQPSWPP
jgi:hypothetical protein